MNNIDGGRGVTRKAENSPEPRDPKRRKIETAEADKSRAQCINYFTNILPSDIRKNIFGFLIDDCCIEIRQLIILGRVCRCLHQETKDYILSILEQNHDKDNFFSPFKASLADPFKSDLATSVLLYNYSINNITNPVCAHFKNTIDHHLNYYINLWADNKFDFNKFKEGGYALYLSNEGSGVSYIFNAAVSAQRFLFTKFLERYFTSKQIIADFKSDEKKVLILDLIDLLAANQSKVSVSDIISNILFHLNEQCKGYFCDEYNIPEEREQLALILAEFNSKGLVEFNNNNDYFIPCSVNSWAEAGFKFTQNEDKYIIDLGPKTSEICPNETPHVFLGYIERFFLSDKLFSQGIHTDNHKFLIECVAFMARNKDFESFPEVISNILFHLGQEIIRESHKESLLYLLNYFAPSGLLDQQHVSFFADYAIKAIAALQGSNTQESWNTKMSAISLIKSMLLARILTLSSANCVLLMSNMLYILKSPIHPRIQFQALGIFNNVQEINKLHETGFKFSEADATFFKKYAIRILTSNNPIPAELVSFVMQFHAELMLFLSNLIKSYFGQMKFTHRDIQVLKDIVFSKLKNEGLDSSSQCQTLTLISTLANHKLLILPDNSQDVLFLKDYCISRISNHEIVLPLRNLSISFLRLMLIQGVSMEDNHLDIIKDYVITEIQNPEIENSIFLATVDIIQRLSSLNKLQQQDWDIIVPTFLQKLRAGTWDIPSIDLILFVIGLHVSEPKDLFPFVSKDYFNFVISFLNQNKPKFTKETIDDVIRYYGFFKEHSDPFIVSQALETVRLLEAIKSANYE